MTLQEPKNPPSADLDGPDTQVMIPPSAASPVFVDSTGRRRRLLRRASYAFGAFCMLYGGLVSVSLAGGPVSPSAVLPLQALAEGGDDTDPDDALSQPSPIPGPNTTTAAPAEVFVTDHLPHRPAPVTHTLERAEAPKPTPAKPTKTAAPKSTPPSAPPSNRPVESATTTPPSSAPSSTPPSSAAPSSNAPAPKPPTVPSSPSAGTGGSGGGETVAEATPPTAAPRVTPDPVDVAEPAPAGIDSAIGSLLDGITSTCPFSTGGAGVAA